MQLGSVYSRAIRPYVCNALLCMLAAKELQQNILRGFKPPSTPAWLALSEEARNLITALLDLDPNNRPSPLGMKKDPWIVTEAKGNENPMPLVTENLRQVSYHWAFLLAQSQQQPCS